MDDLQYGTRNKRGDWRPFKPITYAPVFVWPAQPAKFLKWLFGFPGYIWPWNTFFVAVGALFWYFLTPSLETMQSFTPDWIGYLLLRNAALILIWYSIWHLRLYILRKQDTKFKFNGQWPSQKNDSFLFNNQNIDNVIWTFASALPIWTAWEAVIYWSMSNGYMPVVAFADAPVLILMSLLIVPVWYDFHFQFIHRMLHWAPLYRMIHTIHHNNVNPGPWSGLAMHPVEHVLYFSAPAIFFLVPFHPIHLMFVFIYLVMAPARGHSGFGKIIVFDDKLIPVDSLDHYLHHKYHECNYSEGVVPYDKWFGSFHDGSPGSEQRMMRRFKDKAAKKAAKTAARV